MFRLQGAIPRDAAFTQARCADVQGFSLPAAVRCAADDRQAIEQLWALVPRPRLRLICVHGVLSPSLTDDAKLRALVVPQAPEEITGESARTGTEPGCKPSLPPRISGARAPLTGLSDRSGALPELRRADQHHRGHS